MSDYRKEPERKNRIVTLDIETVSTTPEPNGALEGRTGRVVGIGLLLDDMTRLEPIFITDPDERKILERFWAIVNDQDLLVGFNVLEFDLLFLRQRSMILQVKPSVDVNMKRYYTEDVYDLMAVWNNWGYKKTGCSLDNIAQALGVGQKNGHGYEVNDMWAHGDIDRLREYCMSDVWLEYLCYCKMRFRKPTGMPLPTAKPYDAMLHAAANPVREMVPVQQKGPEAPLTLQAPLASSTTPSVPQSTNSNGKRRSPAKVTYLEMGGALVLNGNTFPIKDALAALGGRRSKKDDNWIWQLPAARFNELAGLCAQNSIRLLPADGALHLPQGA